MPDSATDLRCPACGHELVERAIDDLTVDVCDGGCGGVWFDNGEIADVDDRDETTGEALRRWQNVGHRRWTTRASGRARGAMAS